eukprot:6183981-Pleurochrysis_carterae.AAC.1
MFASVRDFIKSNQRRPLSSDSGGTLATWFDTQNEAYREILNNPQELKSPMACLDASGRWATLL